MKAVPVPGIKFQYLRVNVACGAVVLATNHPQRDRLAIGSLLCQCRDYDSFYMAVSKYISLDNTILSCR